MTDEKTFSVFVCTQGDVKNDLSTGTPKDEFIIRGGNTICTSQLTEHHTTEGEVSTAKRLIVEQTKDAYSYEATTQVEVSGLQSYTDYS